jgi:hypothetical protein
MSARTRSVLVSDLRDEGDRWDVGESGSEPERTSWCTILKSISPTPPAVGTTYRITTLDTGPLGLEIVAIEDRDGIGYGLSPKEIEARIVNDEVEDILSSLSEAAFAAGWEHDMPRRAWELLFALPDPEYPLASGTHADVVGQLVRLLDLTVTHGWWPYELDNTDERGSRIGIILLGEWNDRMPADLRLNPTALPHRRQQLIESVH